MARCVIVTVFSLKDDSLTECISIIACGLVVPKGMF